MADYRDWCASCGRETNFGSHDPDCDYLHAQRIAMQEQRDFDNELHDKYSKMSEEELFDECEVLDKEMSALGNLLSAKERKWRFLNREVLMDFKQRERLAARLGRRYL